jgi:hypothetical protein
MKAMASVVMTARRMSVTTRATPADLATGDRRAEQGRGPGVTVDELGKWNFMFRGD